MKIGIVGSGHVGGTLGTRWAQAGHKVIFGSRDPASEAIKKLVAGAGGTAKAATQKEAAAASDVVLLSTPWAAAREAVEALGDLSGKILVDAVNPFLRDFSALELGTTTSAGEQVASWAPGAKVVKAFNTIGFNVMANPSFSEEKAVLFYCGDDPEAKKVAKQLAGDLGFDAVDAGPLTRARLLEPFALLWVSLAFGGMGREIAFKLLKR